MARRNQTLNSFPRVYHRLLLQKMLRKLSPSVWFYLYDLKLEYTSGSCIVTLPHSFEVEISYLDTMEVIKDKLGRAVQNAKEDKFRI